MVSSVYTVISMIVLASVTVRGNDWEVHNCKDQTFCNEKPKYYDLIQDELDEKVSLIKETFNLNTFDYSSIDEDSDDYYNGTNCATKTEIMTPYTMMINSTVKVIVQSKFFEQKFRKTNCDYERMNAVSFDAKCFDGISTSFTPQCREKFTSITLYLYDIDKKMIKRQPTLVPVCCYCDISGNE